jgi:ubiquinone/menaquinone biosynthesis C-methylase UbiE
LRLLGQRLLEVGPNDRVLEVGFGPGVVIQCLSKLAAAGYAAGIDQSREMVEQARARNATSTRCKSGQTPYLDCEKYSE